MLRANSYCRMRQLLSVVFNLRGVIAQQKLVGWCSVRLTRCDTGLSVSVILRGSVYFRNGTERPERADRNTAGNEKGLVFIGKENIQKAV